MTGWMFWLGAAAVLVILEMFTGTFYLLMLGLGLAAGAAAAFVGLSTPMQFLLAACVGAAGTLVLWRWRSSLPQRVEADRDPNINLDVGQTVFVAAWQTGVPAIAQVNYRGATWEAELEQGVAEPGNYVIRAIRGSRLILGPVNQRSTS